MKCDETENFTRFWLAYIRRKSECGHILKIKIYLQIFLLDYFIYKCSTKVILQFFILFIYIFFVPLNSFEILLNKEMNYYHFYLVNF